MTLLGSEHDLAGKPEQGLAILENALKLQERKFGREDPAALKTMEELIAVYCHLGRKEQGVAIGEEALGVCRAKLGPDDPIRLGVMNDLSAAYIFSGKLDKAIPLLEETLKLRNAKLAPGHPDAFAAMHNLAFTYWKVGKVDQAVSLYEALVKLEKTKLGPLHFATFQTLGHFTALLFAEKRYDDLEKVIGELVPPDIDNPAEAAALLRARAHLRVRRGQYVEATADLTKAKEAKPDDDEVWHELVALLVANGQLEVYREHCRHSLDRFAKTTSPSTAGRIAKDCLILPGSGVDLDLVRKMADLAVSSTNHRDMAWFQLCSGLAEYRQGRFTSAVDWITRARASPDKSQRDVQAYMVMAMAYYRLRHIDEARSAFAKGAELEQTKLAKLENGDLGGDWLDWIIAHALMREAKALIEGVPENKSN